MPLDGAVLAKACANLERGTQLCRAEIGRVVAAAAAGPVLIGCTQETPLFEEQTGVPVATVNLREAGGWSNEAHAAGPKMAALIAAAQVPTAPVAGVRLKSAGVTLIIGRDETAIEAAEAIADKLDITVLLSKPKDVVPPRQTVFPVLKGTVRAAKGALGGFEIIVDDYAQPSPSSRGSLVFAAPRDGAVSKCDVIIDLTGAKPLFPAPEKRDGYLRADPANPAAVARLLLKAVDLVGEFDKPRYIDFTDPLCAHSRSKRVGCTRCLDVCPTSAITPAGNHVAIDAAICAGCGSCAAVCPTGAATYALPRPDVTLARLRALLAAYHAAGGSDAVVLAHDGHGDAMIDALARHGDGLPARVLPFKVNEVTALGIEFTAACLAYGAADLRILVGRRHQGELGALAGVLGVTEALVSGLGFTTGRAQVIDSDDPEEMGAALRAIAKRPGALPRGFAALGGKRDLMKLAVRELREGAPVQAERVLLPPGAPFGAVEIDVAGCTLCLSCVSACPTGALADNPERPMLRFTEDACVQCGLCAGTCPEKVITLKPRFDFTAAAMEPRLIKEEEPANCLRCGKPFGTKATVERIVDKLRASHWMYADDPAKLDIVRMCADCRVIVQSEAKFDPYAGPPRPKPKTNEDYRN